MNNRELAIKIIEELNNRLGTRLGGVAVMLTENILKDNAAEQSVHWTLPMCSVCGESVARKSGMCEDCEMLARQSQ